METAGKINEDRVWKNEKKKLIFFFSRGEKGAHTHLSIKYEDKTERS